MTRCHGFCKGNTRMRVRMLAVVVAISGAIAVAAAEQKPAEKAAPKPAAKASKPLKAKNVSMQERLDALSRATVWQDPPPIAKANLGGDPNDPHEVSCTFEISQLN